MDVRTSETEHFRVPNVDAIQSVAWSPDSTRIAFEGTSGTHSDIFVLDVSSGDAVNLTNDLFSDHEPAWSPDSRSLVFHSDRGDMVETGQVTVHTTGPDGHDQLAHDYSQYDIYRLDLDHRQTLERLTTDEEWDDTNPEFGSDPEKLLFVSDRNGIWNLYEKNLTNGGERPLTDLQSGVIQVSLSWDGQKAAIAALHEGTPSIYVLRDPFGRADQKPTALAPNVWAQRVQGTGGGNEAPSLLVASDANEQRNPLLRDATDGTPFDEDPMRRTDIARSDSIIADLLGNRIGLLVDSSGMRDGSPDGSGGYTNAAFAFDETSTLAVWLQDAGYRTALIGKYLNKYELLTPRVPPGWDEWRVFAEDTEVFFDYHLNENGAHVHYGKDEDDYSTDVLARLASRFIEESAGEPFFLVFAPFAPHDPSTPAPRHHGTLDDLPEWRPPSWFEEMDRGKPGFLRVGTKRVTREGLAKRTRRRIRQLESLLAVDEAVDSIVATLDDLDLSDDTLVIFTADHGLTWGEHRHTGKQVAYEESVRVPFIVRYPTRWPAARALDALVLNVDIAPTVLELAEAVPDIEMEGRSLVDLLDDNESSWRQNVVLRHFSGGFLVPPWDAIRTSRHKLIRIGRGIELYDLEEDPFEIHSLARDHESAEVRRELTEKLDQALAARKDAAGSTGATRTSR